MSKVPEISVKIFGSVESRFGYTVFPTNDHERGLALSCVSKPMKLSGRETTVYPIWVEHSWKETTIYSSEPIGVARDAKEAGSRAYMYTMKKLADEMAEYIRNPAFVPKNSDKRTI